MSHIKTIRALSISERMYVDFSPDFYVIGYLELTGKLDINLLSSSISKVTNQHPLLNAAIEKQDTGPAFVSSSQAKQSNVELSLIQGTDSKSSHFEVLNSPLNLEKALFSVFIYQYSPSEYSFFIKVHHAVADGLSVNNLLCDIMETYSGKDTHIPVNYSLEPIDSYFPKTSTTPSCIQRQSQEEVNLKQPVAVTYNKGARTPPCNHAINLVISEEPLNQLALQAAQVNISLNSMLSAHWIKACSQHYFKDNPQKDNANFSLKIAFDLRRRIEGNISRHALVACASAFNQILNIARASPIKTIASQLSWRTSNLKTGSNAFKPLLSFYSGKPLENANISTAISNIGESLCCESYLDLKVHVANVHACFPSPCPLITFLIQPDSSLLATVTYTTPFSDSDIIQIIVDRFAQSINTEAKL